MAVASRSGSTTIKVAIVHDWLVGGGAERVVLALHQMYPDAPIYTSYCTLAWREKMDGRVVTGWLQHLGRVRKFIPFLRIWWFTHLDLSGYDVVISSSGAEAKGIKVPTTTTHINYCHAPTHYYWSRYDEYLQTPGFGVFDPLARLGLRLLVGPLRRWDYRAAQRPDYLLVNSTHTQTAVKKYYGRDSEVVFPPIDVERFAPKPGVLRERHGFVIASRQTPYKRCDIAIEACTKLKLPLIVVGNGPDHPRLVAMAGPTITFDTNASDKDVARYFQTAEAFLFPALDDFGMVAVEALSAGAPVIAFKIGGSSDYVQPGVTGLLFGEQTAESLVKTLQDFPKYRFDHAAISKSAEAFSVQIFKNHINAFVKKHLDI